MDIFITLALLGMLSASTGSRRSGEGIALPLPVVGAIMAFAGLGVGWFTQTAVREATATWPEHASTLTSLGSTMWLGSSINVMVGLALLVYGTLRWVARKQAGRPTP